MKRRERNLSDGSIEKIVRIIDGWSGPLSWASLTEALYERLHLRYTRQTLHKHERIRQAFAGKKKGLSNRDGTKPRTPRGSIGLQKAHERISRLESEIERLRAESQRLLDQFARWAFSAYQHGISVDELNAALPPISRGQTIAMPAPRLPRVPDIRTARAVDERTSRERHPKPRRSQ
jgi:hypothetical protein